MHNLKNIAHRHRAHVNLQVFWLAFFPATPLHLDCSVQLSSLHSLYFHVLYKLSSNKSSTKFPSHTNSKITDPVLSQTLRKNMLRSLLFIVRFKIIWLIYLSPLCLMPHQPRSLTLFLCFPRLLILLTPWPSLQHTEKSVPCFFTNISFKLCNSHPHTHTPPPGGPHRKADGLAKPQRSLLTAIKEFGHRINKRWSRKREIWREVQRHVMKRGKETNSACGGYIFPWQVKARERPRKPKSPGRNRELPPRARTDYNIFTLPLLTDCSISLQHGGSVQPHALPFPPGSVKASNSQLLSHNFMPLGPGPWQALPV